MHILKETRDKILAAVTSKTIWKNSTFPVKPEAKYWQLLLARPQVLMIGLLHILPNKEEEDRIEYTGIIPSGPWKKKKIKKRRTKEKTLASDFSYSQLMNHWA